MNYADIILPLPLQDSYTYSIPPAMQTAIGVGQRVEVSFGKSKMMIGIVLNLHDSKPTGYAVKPIERLIDSAPIVTTDQLALWQWVATYYVCPLGDVMNAALPSSLKDDSYRPRTETYVTLAGNLEPAKVGIVLNYL